MSAAERILIVDDNPDNITVLANVLGEYEKNIALDGKTALAIAQSDTPPDLILLDIMMPGMDGYEVVSALQKDQQTRGIPVIFVTGLDETESEAKGLEMGAVDFITKPVIPAIVQARVRTHLDLARSRRELEKQNQILQENEELRVHVERMTRHDLKAPLNGIMNIPRLIMETEEVSQESFELLEAMVGSADNMLSMINSSQTLYQIETQQFTLVPRPIDIPALLNKVILSGRSRAGQKHIERVDPENSEACTALGDEFLCYSIFSNVLNNALDASPHQGQITVSYALLPKWVTVSIANVGSVPESIRENFFGKYVSAGKSNGTGLGTYMAKLFVEEQGGAIDLQTDEHMTRVVVWLPLAKP
ncbi:MAG: response regulator [Thermodesulfobacteriota bacterium]